MNWLLIGFGLLCLLCMLIGYIKGLIKIAVSLAATIATVVLVVILTPYVGDFIHSVTPIDEMIVKKCESAMTPSVDDLDLTGTPLEGIDLEQSGLSAEEIKEALGNVEIPKNVQIQAIENAELPGIFKEMLLNNNNSEVYSSLGVTTFPEYVGAFLAKVIINMVAFLITFILVTIVVRTAIFALDVIADLPVLGGVNRLVGAFVGLATALIIMWIFCIIITLLYTTSVGQICFAYIADSKILTFIYNNNYILSNVAKLY